MNTCIILAELKVLQNVAPGPKMNVKELYERVVGSYENMLPDQDMACLGLSSKSIYWVTPGKQFDWNHYGTGQDELHQMWTHRARHTSVYEQYSTQVIDPLGLEESSPSHVLHCILQKLDGSYRGAAWKAEIGFYSR